MWKNRRAAALVSEKPNPSAPSEWYSPGTHWAIWSCCSRMWSLVAMIATMTVLLLVDGTTVTSDADQLAKVTVRAEVVKATKGPKITIMKFKNKTGYRKRQGHRQHTTQIKVTAIDA